MRKNSIVLFILCLFLYSFNTIYAQVIAEGDTILCDGQQGEVEVVLSATSFAVDLTDSGIYTDDLHGGVINMGFDFTFYGNTYSDVVLSSNNFLTFNTAVANTYSDWTIDEAVPSNTDPPMNAILCPWQDINPGFNGNGIIAYATIGEEPNRIFIASFCGIPMYSCTDICYSSQIKLFESTNVIETHIAQKVLCPTWNSGYAIHALHNDNGSIAHVVTGLDGIERNFPNAWTCENDGWRFTPNGDNDYLIENIEFAPAVAGTDIVWQDEFGNIIGTGSEITVVAGGNVTYTAGASLCGDAGDWCGFEGGIEGDDVTILFEELEINGNDNDILCYQANDGSIEINAPNTGNWIYNLYDDNMTLLQSEQLIGQSFTFLNLSQGIYYANIAEASSACISEEILFEIIEPSQINSTNSTNDVTCFNGDDGLIEIEISGGTPPYTTFIGNTVTPIIETQTGNPIIFSNLPEGNYFYTTIDSNGCLINEDEVFFNIEAPLELLIELNEIGDVNCNAASDGFININVSGGVLNYTYSWSNDNGFFSDADDIEGLSGGDYIITVTDQNGCTNTENITISENDPITIQNTTTECINNNGIITTSITGGTPEYFYSLLFENEVIATNSTGVFTGLAGGQYSIVVSDYFNCEIQDNVILNTAPIADFSLEEYEFSLSNTPVEFTDLSIDDNISSWLWNFGDGSSSNEQNPSYLYSNPGTYYVTLTIIDANNCEDTITKEVKILQDFYSYTPNIFTPNDDGTNDTFSPSLLNIDMNTYNLLVYDRWGNQLFESDDYNKGWDGKLKNGKLMPPDVYSYKITYKTNLGIEKQELGKIIMAR